MVPDWVIQRVTDGTAMRVYLHLACKYADAERHAFPEMGDLAVELEISERTVKRAVATLQVAGAIQVARVRQSDGYFGRNLYTLPLDDLASQGTNLASGSDQHEQLTQVSDLSPGVDQGEQGGGAGQDQGPDMASGLTDPAPGVDQGEHGVSAGGNQGTNMAPPGGDKYGPSKEQPDPKKQPENSSSDAASAGSDRKPRGDVEQLCAVLRDGMLANECKVPPLGKRWRDAARLLLDRDKRPLDEALDLLAWSQTDEFWRGNIQSMPTFRAQYDKLRLRWQQTNPVRHLRSEDAIKHWLRELWKEGRVKPIEERSGLRYPQPELPEGINSVEKAREFHLAAIRTWINGNHDEIIKRIQQREQPVAS